MSLLPIPYQPLPVDTEENCTLPCAVWFQKIERSDPTQLQFQVSPCTSMNNLLDNPEFTDGTDWIFDGGWQFLYNRAFSPLTSKDVIYQSQTVASDLTLRLDFTIDIVEGNVNLYINNGAAFAVISQSGNYTFTFSSNDFIFVKFDVPYGSSAYIINPVLKVINERFRVAIVDLEGNEIATLNTSSYDLTRNYLTITVDWGSLDVGCYQLAISDPCECSQFGFIGDDLTTVNNQFTVPLGDVTVGSGSMLAENVTEDRQVLRKKGLLCKIEYDVEYTLSGMQAGDEFFMRLGTAVGVTRTTDGTYSETITAAWTGFPTEGITLDWVFDHLPASGQHVITLTDFSIVASEPIASYTTVPFKIIEDDSKCTTLFNACGNYDQFNFGFGDTGFSPRIRLEGTLRGVSPKESSDSYEYSSGFESTYYSRLKKQKSFIFGAPEYVHDFMAVGRRIDNFYINEVAYHTQDDEYPSMSIDDDVDYAGATLLFAKRSELTEKRNKTSDVKETCTTDGSALLSGVTSTTGSGNPRPIAIPTGQIIRN